jgi:hypothetical protein
LMYVDGQALGVLVSPAALSPGQRQQLCIARALLKRVSSASYRR